MRLIQWLKRLYKRDLYGWTRAELFHHIQARHTGFIYMRLDPGDKWALHVNGKLFTQGEVKEGEAPMEGFICGAERLL